MSELPAPASGPSPRLRAFGTFEGYFSLVLTLIYLSLPVKNHLSWDEAFVKIVLLASAYSCGVGGLRFGRTAGKRAAAVSLLILTVILVHVVFMSWTETLSLRAP